MNILVTGAAGFVGFHSCVRFLEKGHQIIGIDNINNYYDVRLKHTRLENLQAYKNFKFEKLDLADRQGMANLFKSYPFDVVLHLGAQAGVRYSIDNPFAYLDSNLTGMLTVLEGCRHHGVKHLIYASSSSVYGANTKLPFSEEDRVETPISLYAATKKADELMAHTYAHLYNFPITGLRFFTVYGPLGRPDMAYFKFADSIVAGRPIDVYNFGDMKRDFTYIDDIINGIESILNKGFVTQNDGPPHQVYNLGHNHPENLVDMICILEEKLGKKATKNFLPMQPGDVYATYANINAIQRDYGFTPKTSLSDGLNYFAEWYKKFYKHNINF